MSSLEDDADSKSLAQLAHDVKHGNGAAQQAWGDLCRSPILLVILQRQARYYARTYSVSADDLLQEGYLAIQEAALAYDTEKNVPFARWVRYHIRSKMQRFVGAQQGPVRTRFHPGGSAPAIPLNTVDEIGEDDDGLHIRGWGQQTTRQSGSVREDFHSSHYVRDASFTLPADDEDADDAVMVRGAWTILPLHHRAMLTARVLEEQSYVEVGEALDLSHEAVRQKTRKALEALRRALHSPHIRRRRNGTVPTGR